MNKFLLTIAFTLCGLLPSLAQSQVIPLTVDSTQSSAVISVGGAIGISRLSGDATIDLESTNPPSGSAQITELDLVLDDAVDVSFALGLLSGTTSPGDVTISLETPGSPGTISGTSFDQLANSLTLGGDFVVTDLFGVAGGSQTIDLSTFDLSPADFTSIDVEQSGNDITVTSSFLITETLNLGAGPFGLILQGTIIANGEVPVSIMLGDVNLDSAVNMSDISPFIKILATSDFQAEADINQNDQVNFIDVLQFVGILISQ